jgi:hypothetical protein
MEGTTVLRRSVADPHRFGLDPDPDSHQSGKAEAFEGPLGALEVPNPGKIEW